MQQGQADASTMQFIDFEYGSYNYRGFDFGNHWCEYAGFDGDYSRYPDSKQQATFVRAYLQQQGNKSPVKHQYYGLLLVFALMQSVWSPSSVSVTQFLLASVCADTVYGLRPTAYSELQ